MSNESHDEFEARRRKEIEEAIWRRTPEGIVRSTIELCHEMSSSGETGWKAIVSEASMLWLINYLDKLKRLPDEKVFVHMRDEHFQTAEAALSMWFTERAQANDLVDIGEQGLLELTSKISEFVAMNDPNARSNEPPPEIAPFIDLL